jgi:hypothetical protein
MRLKQQEVRKPAANNSLLNQSYRKAIEFKKDNVYDDKMTWNIR